MLDTCLLALLLAQDPIAPHSASEPPAAKQAASLTASTKDSLQNLLTTGEKTGWNETAPYAEAVEISHRLERASRFVKVMDIGTTPEGRTMIALVISKDRAFTPEAAAQRLNLNRDYMKADTPEMRAWLRAFNTWMPDFLIDNHVTDGSDMQYDVTWDMARNQDIAEPAGDWVREKYVPELDKRMAADGHLVAPYGALRNRQFFMEVFSPRYSHLYSAVQNRPSLLVETHSLKAARTRAWANYDIMRHTFDIVTADAESRRKAVRDADRAIESRAGDRGRSEHRKSDRASHPRPGKSRESSKQKEPIQPRKLRPRKRHPAFNSALPTILRSTAMSAMAKPTTMAHSACRASAPAWFESMFMGCPITATSRPSTSADRTITERISTSPPRAAARCEVTGTVRDAGGKAVPGAIVQLCDKSGESVKAANTDQNGAFDLKGLAPGEYKTFAWEDRGDGVISDPDFRKTFESKSTTVKLSEKSRENIEPVLITKDAMEIEAAKIR